MPDRERPLAVLTDLDLPDDGTVEDLLASAGIRFRRARCRGTADVLAAARDASALLVQWAPITADVLDGLPNCRFITRLGIGYDRIDVDAATERGVAVANNPDYCVEEVATHTIALIMATARRVLSLDRSVRNGQWSAISTAASVVRTSHSTLAVLGFGRIGTLTAFFAAALGFRVLVHDPHVDPGVIRAAGHEPAGLADALRAADVLTLHLPLTEHTQHLLDRAAIGTLKPGCLIVNTCRGGLIDEAALHDAMVSGQVAAAAMDVFESEPLPEDSPLRGLPNLIITPHAAWLSVESMRELPRRAARQVVDFLQGRPVASIVNPGYARARTGGAG